jgi:hypothetical protein
VNAAPCHLYYDFAEHSEYCLSYGDTSATRKILIVPPLFDEMNRTRCMLVSVMRELAGRGVGSYLPDLPGCNESLADIANQTLGSWQSAVAAAARAFGATHIASIRGGALIDSGSALPHWRLVPAKGSSILKTMLRTRIAADKEAGRSSDMDILLAQAQSAPIELSGYSLSAAMLFSLEHGEIAAIQDVHEVTLGDGDGTIKGVPLWLRAEPQSDAAMSLAVAADLDRWSASCGG